MKRRLVVGSSVSCLVVFSFKVDVISLVKFNYCIFEGLFWNGERHGRDCISVVFV